MPSLIDPSKFIDNQPASKKDLRDMFDLAKSELEHGGWFKLDAQGAIERPVVSKLDEIISGEDFGAVADAKTYKNASIALGSNRLRVPQAGFGGEEVGKLAVVPMGDGQGWVDALVIAVHGPEELELDKPALAAVSGGTVDIGSDNTEALQAFLEACAQNSIGQLRAGTYLTGELRMSVGRWGLRGIGRRGVTLRAKADVSTMLSIERDDAPKLGNVVLSHFRLDGAGRAARGLSLKHVNFSFFEDIEIFQVAGIGLDVRESEDIISINLDVRHCGDFEAQLPGIMIKGPDGIGGTNATNSMVFLGGTFERHRYHAVQLDMCEAVRFVGSKFHGRTLADDEAPQAVDLVHADNVRRVQIIACQFAHIRGRGVYLSDHSHNQLICSGCTFSAMANYQPDGRVWAMVLEGGRVALDSLFFEDALEHASYTTGGGSAGGGDIFIGDNVLRCPAPDSIHMGSPGSDLHYDGGHPNRLARRIGTHWLHVDSEGQLRFNASFPTGDRTGTIVTS